MNHKNVTQLKPGDRVTQFFVLRKKEIRAKYDSDDLYLALELGDASGRIRATLWNDVKETDQQLSVGDVIKVQGKIVSFKEKSHLNIEKVRKAVEKDQVDLGLLLPKSDKDLGQLNRQLDEWISRVQDTFLQQLLQSVFQDAEIRRAFGQAPGGKLWHHNYLGGLLEHTLSVTGIAVAASEQYPAVNRDLLIAAGLLHDIGKIHSYTYRTLIDFTDEGRLIGHIVLGAEMVSERIKQIPDFPESLRTALLHLILSHQGKLEQASPVVPMMLEGILLYHADEIDSKAAAFLRIKKKEKRPGVRWSSYIPLINQYYFLGDDES